jgi:Cdc6-like AAA superfamily ATPase
MTPDVIRMPNREELRLALDLTLPLDLVTHVTLCAGKRGSGKTNTAKRIVEQAVRSGVPVAVLDPADV